MSYDIKDEITNVLTSIKKLSGISEDYPHFNTNIIMYINSTLMTLSQLGVKFDPGFFIINESTKWEDLMKESYLLHFIKTYIYLKVQLSFDPPASSVAVESIKQLIDEAQWRIMNEIETGIVGKEEINNVQ